MVYKAFGCMVTQIVCSHLVCYNTAVMGETEYVW